MKKYTMMGALFAVLALSVTSIAAMMPAAASALTTQWLCAEKVVPKAEECFINSENLEIFLLQDRNADAQVECPVGDITDEGWVGPGAEDRTTKVTFKSCVGSAKAENLKEEEVANDCKAEAATVSALNLPWKTKIEVVGGVNYDTITPVSGTKQPGYETTCKTALGSVTDKCEGSEAHPVLVRLDNLALEGTEFPLVDVLFPAKKSELLEGEKEFAKCTIGGAESGFVLGEQLLAALIGGAFVTLEVSEA